MPQRSLIASLPLHANNARSRYYPLDCCCENPASFVVRPNSVSFDRVRLALPRSPESGIEVSTDGKNLSREKRKIWMSFSQCAHILWSVCWEPIASQIPTSIEFLRRGTRKLFRRNILRALYWSHGAALRGELFSARDRSAECAKVNFFWIFLRPTVTHADIFPREDGKIRVSRKIPDREIRVGKEAFRQSRIYRPWSANFTLCSIRFRARYSRFPGC